MPKRASKRPAKVRRVKVKVTAVAVVDADGEIRGLHRTDEHIGIVLAMGCKIVKLTGYYEADDKRKDQRDGNK